MSIWGAAIGIIGGALLSDRANDRAEASNAAAIRAGDEQDLANAQENLQLQIGNSQIIQNIGGLNAEQILEIGHLNAEFIINAMERNIELMRIEQAEELRRHINAEVESAGLIRAGYAGSGISVSSGSALAVRLASMRDGELDRLYQDDITNRQILGYFETETERAALVLREAELGAEAALANAEAESSILVAEAQAAVNNANRNLNGSSSGQPSNGAGGGNPKTRRL